MGNGFNDLTAILLLKAFKGTGKSDNSIQELDKSIGTTFPPAQRSAEPKYDDCEEDMPNIHEATADDIHAYIDNVASGKPTVTKEIMGKDSSGKYDIARYTYAKREYLAWVKENYPKMYAWKNGNAVKYTTSVAPRKQDSAYDVPYIKKGGTTTETVTVPALAILYEGYRWSMSGGGFKADSTYVSLILPLPIEGVTQAVVSFTGIVGSTSAGYGGTTNTSFTSQVCSGDPWTYPARQTFTAGDSLNSLTGLKFLTIPLTAQDDYSNITITLNGVAVNYKVGEPSEAKQESTTTTEVETEGDAGVPVTAISATRRSRTIGGVEYVRYEAGDVEPTVIYTDKDDDRNSGATITKDGVTYSRYPLGDLGANRKKLLPIVIWANVHGTPKVIPDTITSATVATVVETKMCALIAARVMRDLAAEKQLNNPLYQFIRENCMVIVIPVANPYGFNCNVTDDPAPYSGYYNANSCNINRNHDTPGWDVMRNNGSESAMTMGQYPASENETQYLDNTMVESGAVVAMSLHGGDRRDKYCLHQGQNPSPDGTGYVEYDADKLDAIGTFLNENYGYTLKYYDEIEGVTTRVNNTPDKTSKDPSFISQCGAYGGILELAVNDPDVSGHERAIRGKVVEAAYAQVLNFTAMWLDDYMENSGA